MGRCSTREGAAFADITTARRQPVLLSDIDNYALEYFLVQSNIIPISSGMKPHLFIPFDEKLASGYGKSHEKRFANWQGQSFDEATLELQTLRKP